MTKEEIKEYKRKYLIVNKDRIAEQTREYRLANKDRKAEYDREYKKANKDRLAERDRKYDKANKGRIAEHKKEYYKANKDRIAELHKKYRKVNKDRIAEYHKEYAKANPDKINAKFKKREALKRNQLHPDRNDNIIKTFYQLSTRLTKCTNIPHNVDHIIPLSCGGYHHEDNLQVIPATLNFQKKDNIHFIHPLLKTYKHVPESLKIDKLQ